jgi:hypothetical protein
MVDTTVSSPSILIFIGITAAYSIMQYLFESTGMRLAVTLIYFLVVLVVQYFLNLNVAKNLCGTPQYGTAILVTAVPWFVIFGILKAVLTVFPGWLSPFSNTIGYGVSRLAGVRSTLEQIVKSPGKTSKKSNGPLDHIYNDPSLLINEITPANFDTFWSTMKQGGLLLDGAANHMAEMRKLVRLKDIVSEFIWFVITGSLVSSVSFNYMINTACSKSADDIKKNVAKLDADRKAASKKSKQPQKVYTTRE